MIFHRQWRGYSMLISRRSNRHFSRRRSTHWSRSHAIRPYQRASLAFPIRVAERSRVSARSLEDWNSATARQEKHRLYWSTGAIRRQTGEPLQLLDGQGTERGEPFLFETMAYRSSLPNRTTKSCVIKPRRTQRPTQSYKKTCIAPFTSARLSRVSISAGLRRRCNIANLLQVHATALPSSLK